MEKVRVAQIGINRFSHGRQIFAAMKKQKDLFEIAGYCIVEDQRERFADILNRFDGYKELTLEEILNDETITAVTVETEEKHLLKYALMAASHGKHVHMEKPGGTELAEFEQLVETVRKTGKVFHVGYMYRYNPVICRELQNIKDGVYGKIQSTEAQMSCVEPAELRRWLGGYPGGMMFFLGCHLIDLTLQIMGEPKQILCMNRASGLDGIESTDLGNVVFDYGDAIAFIKTSGVEIGGFERRQLVATGSKGSFEIKPLEWFPGGTTAGLQTTTCTTRFPGNLLQPGEQYTCDGFDRYAGMMAAFAQYVRGEKENPYTPEYELLLYKTILKCCK